MAQVHAEHRACGDADFYHGQNTFHPVVPGAVHEVAGQDGAAHAQSPTVGRLPAPTLAYELPRPGVALYPVVLIEHVAGAESVRRLHGKVGAVDGYVLLVPELVVMKIHRLKLSQRG